MINYKIYGYNRVRNNLRRLAAINSEILQPAMKDWGQNVRRKLKKTAYPPKRPNQKYIRTGRLANSWRVGANQYGIEIQNKASYKGKFYANYVVGPEYGPIGQRQAWMHKGRWWHAEDIVNEEMPGLTKMLTRKIEDTWQAS